MKKIINIFFISILAFGIFGFIVSAQAADGICFKPNVPIPGMGAIFNQDGASSCSDGGYIITSNSIGTYVNALYTYGARLAGIVAMFMIVFASWQWLMAAGNSSKIENAKDTIQGALIGLALLFAGQLLLSNISSRLVDFKGLDLQNIAGSVNNQTSSAINECSLSNILANTPCGTPVQTPDPNSNNSFICLGQFCEGTLSCVYLTSIGDGEDQISFLEYVPCPNNQDELDGASCGCRSQEEIDNVNNGIFPGP